MIVKELEPLETHIGKHTADIGKLKEGVEKLEKYLVSVRRVERLLNLLPIPGPSPPHTAT